MNDFMQAQKKRIELEKWLEGCRINCDPGMEFIIEWIKNNAADFRETWDKSLCKKCYYSNDCGFEVKQYCDKYLVLSKQQDY